jgi:TolB-like protein/Flp pilus assembly protein TadD
MPAGSQLRFGAFELDLGTGELRRQGRKVKLAPQPFQVLALLARSSGQLITRETLREQLWGRHTVVDFEHGLNFCIRQIRSALGESARRPRFIETLPRRGYRFVIPRATQNNGHGDSVVADHAGRDTPAAVHDAHLTSIVVVEFENLSRDEASDWLATGLAETLAADLRRLPSMRVASRDRTRAMIRELSGTAVAGSGGSHLDLGRKMGADWVVTGSYQQAWGRLRITPQLLGVESGDIVPIDKTDGTWDDIFELQDRVTNTVIEALKLKVDPNVLEQAVAPEPRLLEAYEHYSRGRRGLYQLGRGTLEQARQHFERALELEPDYAMAHSGLGAAHAMRFIARTSAEDLRAARAHLERARELDPELPEPYPWLCYVYIREGRLPEALQAGQRGVQLLPDLAHAQYFLAGVYLISYEAGAGDYQSAANHLREAARIDPSWQATWYVLGSVALINGNYERAEAFSRVLLQLNRRETGAVRFIGAEVVLGAVELRRGNFTGATSWFTESVTTHTRSAHVYRDLVCAMSHCGLGDSYLRLSNPAIALTHYRRAWQTVQEAPTMLAQERAGTRALAGLAAAHAANGEVERARELLSQSLQWLSNASLLVHFTPVAWLAEILYGIAVAQVRTGQQLQALLTLEQAVNVGWRDAAWPEQDPEMRALVQQPRFAALLERLSSSPPLGIAIPTPNAR